MRRVVKLRIKKVKRLIILDEESTCIIQSWPFRGVTHAEEKENALITYVVHRTLSRLKS